jgi:NADH-quinone oxidoreductase subunit C
MTRAELVSRLRERFGDRLLEAGPDALEPFVRVAPETWPELALHLRDECGLDYLSCLTGIDRGKGQGLEAVYNLERMDADRLGISVRIRVPYEEPVIPSVETVWRTADWHEREAYDLLGIRFAGHHNLVRILCAEDWEGHALRKDYRSPDTYHGVRNNVV